MTINSDGFKLAMFRKAHSIRQSDVAAVLWPIEQEDQKKKAASIRKISHIEGGERKLADDEITKLIAKWPDFKNFAPTPSKELMRCLESEEFLTRQQTYLNDDHHKGLYDLWLFNGQSQAILDSERYCHSWTTNISNGSNYSILWDLGNFSEADVHQLILFCKIIMRVLNPDELDNNQVEKADSDGQNRVTGKITIFLFMKDCSSWSPECRDRYKALEKGISREVTKNVEKGAIIRDKFEITQPFICWQDGENPAPDVLAPPFRIAVKLLIDCYHAAASTVVYLPKNSDDGLTTLAAIEPPNVPRGFDTLDNLETRHMLLEPGLAFSMGKTVREFQQWTSVSTNLARIVQK